MDYFDGLPNEMVTKILYKSDYNNVISMCMTNKRIENICEDENFWENYVLLNYLQDDYYDEYTEWVDYSSDYQGNIWKDLAEAYSKGKPILVFSQFKKFFISISKDMKPNDIFEKILEKLNNTNNLSYEISFISPFNYFNDYYFKYINKIVYIYYKDQWIEYVDLYDKDSNDTYESIGKTRWFDIMDHIRVI